jgi:hypothetical protein
MKLKIFNQKPELREKETLCIISVFAKSTFTEMKYLIRSY